MKRPLVCLGAVFLLFLAVLHGTGSPLEGFSCRQAAAFLEQEAKAAGMLAFCGTVSDCRAVSAGQRLSLNHIIIQKKETSDIHLPSDLKLILTITEMQTELKPGDQIAVEGSFRAYEKASNPGQFDAQAYYSAQNIVGSVSCKKLSVLHFAAPGIRQTAYRLRCVLRESCKRILEDRPARTIAAISLGEKDWLEQEWKEVYREGGIAHILAVSGLHISLVGRSIYDLMRRIGLGFCTSSFLAGGSLLFYVMMTGFSVSAVRAAILFVIWLGAQICGRKYDMLTGTSVAACLLAGSNAENLFQPSFLLSFLAILSLAVLAPTVTESCRPVTKAGRAFAVSFSVWLGMLPVTLYFFFEVSVWSIFVNLAVVPLLSVLLAFGLLSAFIGLFSGTVGTFFAAPVSWLLILFEKLCGLEQKLPAPLWVAGRPSMLCIAAYYGILLTAVFRSGRRKTKKQISGRQRCAAAGSWLFCAVICLLLMEAHPGTGLSIDCLDVGQGDCALLRLPDGTSCLVDAGSTSRRNIWEQVIEPAVKYYGIRRIDYIFLSHADADHINGILEYLEAYTCGAAGKNVHGVSAGYLVLPPGTNPEDFSELRQLAAGKQIGLLHMEAGGSVRGKNWEICALAPDPEQLTGERNEDSMVLKLSYGQFSMLFTGDLEGDSEKRLARSGADLRADVLKAGHHGSAQTGSEEFLEKVQPGLAVVSCGRNNRYGHPDEETVRRMEAAGSAVYVTAQCGAVRITTDGRTFSVKSTGNYENFEKKTKNNGKIPCD